MSRNLHISICVAILVSSCASTRAPTPAIAGPFVAISAKEGRVYRVNTITGETWLVGADSMQQVAESSAPLLEIGRKYFIEGNRSVTYLGNGKFTEPVKDYSSIWK